MKRAIVVGSGAAGAAAAKALQGPFEVVVYESGREFRPFKRSLDLAEKLKRAGLLRDAREIGLIFPPMRTARTKDGLVLVWGRATGGTTTMTAGNALRMDGDLRALGVDLDAEFDELRREIPVSDGHRARWRESTRRLFEGRPELFGLAVQKLHQIIEAQRKEEPYAVEAAILTPELVMRESSFAA